jgi:outer membrane biosynthesis protein TonB
MHNTPMPMPGEEHGGFRRNFLRVLAAHVVLILLAWAGGRLLFKRHAPEPITWLDGGGELGSAAALALPESGDTSPSVKPEPQVLPPLPPEPPPTPPDPLPAPKDFTDVAMLTKPTPTPTPRPRPTATPAPKRETPKPSTTPKPKPKPTATPKSSTTAKKGKSTPATKVAKLATPRPGAKVPSPNITDAGAKPEGAGTGKGSAKSGSGDSTNAGTKGGPGAAGGSNAVLLGYFKKVEQQFHREWEQPLTVVRSGKDVEAHVRLKAAADGTVESLVLVKPTGNLEVDQSIEQALQRVKKVERPPAELLKNGVLDEMVAFILEL